jgi:putative peptidoglycan lipid II flippase
MAPVALGLGVFQINVVVDSLLAMIAAPWAPAALTYAQRLIYLPLGLFGTAMATVLLPTFSRQVAKNEHAEILVTLSMALRNLIVMMLPASIGMLVLAVPIVRLVFAWTGGEFSQDSTLLTARAVMFYAPGLVFFSMYKVFVPVFYAFKDTRTPVRIGMSVVALNFLLNVLSVLFLPLYYKHAGLASSTVIASAVNCFVLGYILHKRVGSPGWGPIVGTTVRTLISSLVMAGMVGMSHSWLTTVAEKFEWGMKTGQLVAVTGSIAAGLIVYGFLAFLFCRREIHELLGRKHPSPSLSDPINGV